MPQAGRATVAAATARRIKSARDWQRTHEWPPDLGAYEREIAPGLNGVTAAEIAAATGLSLTYCRRLRQGQVTPHPMWWGALQALVR
jgi:hypothetical protein